MAARDVIDWDHQPGQEPHHAEEAGETARGHQAELLSGEDEQSGNAAADAANAGGAVGVVVPVESDCDTESLSHHGDADPDMAGWDVASDHEQEQPASPPVAAADDRASAAPRGHVSPAKPRPRSQAPERSPDASVAATNRVSPSVSPTEASRSPGAPSSGLWSPREGGAAASSRGTSALLDDVAKRSQMEKSPPVSREHVFIRVVPESPLLSWNPDDASEAFGGFAPPAKRHAADPQGPVGQVLVPETQRSTSQEDTAVPQRQGRRESIFVPETQMPPPVPSPRVRQPTGPLAQQIQAASRKLTDGSDVLVPETQREQDNALSRKFPGWLSQSVEAAMVADGDGAPSPVSSGGSVAEPTLYTASMAAPPADADGGGAAYSSDEEERSPLPQQDQHASPFRVFSDDEVPPSPLLASSEAVRSPLPQQRPRQRETRGFESSSDDEDAARDSNDEALSPPRWVKQRQRAVQSQMRSTSNPFAASAIAQTQRSAGCTDRRNRPPSSGSASQQPRISMNPAQPDLASILRQNAAPLPHKRRRAGSPAAARRPRAVGGKRPRPTFSWTDKPQPGLADTFSQRSEAVRAVQKKKTKKTKGVSAKQQRLTSWAAKVG